MTSPYSNLRDHQFWRRSVSRMETHLLDPVVDPRFRIAPKARVATAGSCFAQHISRRLREIGFTYYVAETGEHLPQAQRVPYHYGVFSARYGNIYTTTQLYQLFLEAFGERTPGEQAWQRPDGRWIDPYRQQVEPEGFASPRAVAQDRAKHLAAVREMFLTADVFVFTMGLTEAWRARADGSVFPLAPGVVGGAFDPDRYEGVNFGVTEVAGDLVRFLDRLKAINPAVRVLLTVSPVPLIATFEKRHVLTSNTYSKAVLRVVADMVTKAFDWTDYFPSFEIITGSYAGGLYYEDDHREVNRIGVAHAMRCFLKNYVTRDSVESGEEAAPPAPVAPVVKLPTTGGIVCDEEAIDLVRRRA